MLARSASIRHASRPRSCATRCWCARTRSSATSRGLWRASTSASPETSRVGRCKRQGTFASPTWAHPRPSSSTAARRARPCRRRHAWVALVTDVAHSHSQCWCSPAAERERLGGPGARLYPPAGGQRVRHRTELHGARLTRPGQASALPDPALPHACVCTHFNDSNGDPASA